MTFNDLAYKERSQSLWETRNEKRYIVTTRHGVTQRSWRFPASAYRECCGTSYVRTLTRPMCRGCQCPLATPPLDVNSKVFHRSHAHAWEQYQGRFAFHTLPLRCPAAFVTRAERRRLHAHAGAWERQKSKI